MTRPRTESKEALVEVSSQARRYLPSDEAVKRWMQAPQTFLYGATPAEYLQDGGDPQFLVDNLRPVAHAVSDRVREAAASIEAGLSEAIGSDAQGQL